LGEKRQRRSRGDAGFLDITKLLFTYYRRRKYKYKYKKGLDYLGLMAHIFLKIYRAQIHTHRYVVVFVSFGVDSEEFLSSQDTKTMLSTLVSSSSRFFSSSIGKTSSLYRSSIPSFSRLSVRSMADSAFRKIQIQRDDTVRASLFCLSLSFFST